MDWAARHTARNPDPQSMLTKEAGTSLGRPAPIDAWRPGFWHWPKIRQSVYDGGRASIRVVRDRVRARDCESMVGMRER